MVEGDSVIHFVLRNTSYDSNMGYSVPFILIESSLFVTLSAMMRIGLPFRIKFLKPTRSRFALIATAVSSRGKPPLL